MEFSYYDLLSRIIIGYFTLMASLYAFDISYNEDYSIAYIAAAFVVGYFINAVSSILESFWFWTIGGKPSDKLLTIDKKKKYTGISKVRLYNTTAIIERLKKDSHSKSPSTGELFYIAERVCNGNKDCRIPVFSAQYAFSRVLLTAFTIVTIFLLWSQFDDWRYYFLIIPWLVFWNRFKERGYYYAREVLTEYMKNGEQTFAK